MRGFNCETTEGQLLHALPFCPLSGQLKRVWTHCQTLDAASYGQKPTCSTHGHMAITSFRKAILQPVPWY